MNCVKCGGELDKESSGAICSPCSLKEAENTMNGIKTKLNETTVERDLRIDVDSQCHTNRDPKHSWEYKVIQKIDFAGKEGGITTSSIEAFLNNLGAEGWELMPTPMPVYKKELYILKRIV